MIGHLATLAKPLSDIARKTELEIKEKNIKFIFSNGAHRAHVYAYLKGAQTGGAKILTWQHGAFGAYGDRYMKYDDISISDYHIAPGAGDCDLHASDENIFEEKCKPLGFMNTSYSIQRAKSYKPTTISRYTKTKIILYATTMYYVNRGIFSEFNGIWKDSLVYENQKIILESLKKIQTKDTGIRIILKMHPIEYPGNTNLKMMSEYAAPDFKIIHQKPSFNNLLERADVILLDTPATTLLQSITTTKPIFVLNSNLKLRDTAVILLRKRAVVDSDPNELLGKLEKYLTDHIYDADVNDNSFIENYCDPLGDANLYKRVCNLIVSL